MDHLLPAPELGGILEIREIGQVIGLAEGTEDLLVDLVADVRLPLQRNHVLEARPWRDRDRRVRQPRVLVADVLNEEQNENVILVLAGVHAAAQFVAVRPERAVEF